MEWITSEAGAPNEQRTNKERKIPKAKTKEKRERAEREEISLRYAYDASSNWLYASVVFFALVQTGLN